MTAHPLADLAAAYVARADRIDENIECRIYATPGVAAQAERDSVEHRRTARLLLSLHPDVARCALALADGLRVPEGWRVEMDDEAAINVVHEPTGGRTRIWIDPDQGSWTQPLDNSRLDCDTAQEAVDAAVRALGGTP